MRYRRDIEDEQGDLIELEVYCGPDCFRAGTGEDPFGHAWPCPEMTDSRQCCPFCDRITVAAIGEGSFDAWPDNPDVWPVA